MKSLKNIASLCMATTVAFTAQYSIAATQWDLPLAWPADNFITKAVTEFTDDVKATTNGELDIITHPGGSLGFKGPDMFGAVRDGLVPIGDMLLSQQTGEDPRLGLASLPYLIGSLKELEKFGTFYRPLLDEIYAKNNQKILFTLPWPDQQIFTTEAIETIDDMKNVKIRTFNKSTTEVFEAVGMTPVQLPWGEVVPSLASGAIDAVATSAASAVDGSFWEFLGYIYPTRQSWNTNVVSVNLDYWNDLSKDNQQKIEALAKEFEPKVWASIDGINVSDMKKLTDHGMVAGTISDDLRAKFKELASPLREKEIKLMGPSARKVVDAFQAAN
ncbi:TRAP transporter substrate-binding protein [Marinomonas colpomeniae]|uniref:TRAP transporter substrate-binding protein n=1 Tax=Marinomonas colpomeniae TaxID=2774408 RepID=A0ABR8NU47_9GAMM|nr:TRAP transporter substrate-binding protein [Marinomonas colpomeniae]MBD5769580.1 TRAP transporter substrate-binding protein [Marinomonas colpomeniae]